MDEIVKIIARSILVFWQTSILHLRVGLDQFPNPQTMNKGSLFHFQSTLTVSDLLDIDHTITMKHNIVQCYYVYKYVTIKRVKTH